MIVRRIIRVIWSDHKLEAIIASIMLFIVGLLNGISIVAIIPLLNSMTVGEGANPSFFQKMFEQLFSVFGAEVSFLNILIGIMIVSVIKSVFSISQEIISKSIQLNVEIQKKENLMAPLLNTEATYLYKQNIGKVIDVILYETRLLGKLVNFISRFAIGVINLCIYIVIAFLISGWLTLFAGIVSATAYFLMKNIFLRAEKIGYRIGSLNGMLQGLVNNIVNGYKVIKSFVIERALEKEFGKILIEIRKLELRLVKTESLMKSVLEPLVLGLCLVVYLLFKFDIAVLLAFLVVLYRMYEAFQGIQNTHYKMARHSALLSLYDETLTGLCLHQYPEEDEGIEFKKLEKGIALNGVRFSYVGSEGGFNLGPLDIWIPKGSMVGLVGPSGSGKSTSVDLIEGLLTPDGGKIEIDGIPLDGYNIASFRKKIGYVPQDIFLLNDTVSKNIAFFENNISEQDIIRSCVQANATEMIEKLPEGFKTVLGEKGARLSGGQRQRIALARALVRSPEILILDEATSALDSESERRIQGAIDSLGGDVTRIVIAHRLSTVRNADYIYFIKEGKVVEEGSYDDLMAKNGYFFKMRLAAR